MLDNFLMFHVQVERMRFQSLHLVIGLGTETYDKIRRPFYRIVSTQKDQGLKQPFFLNIGNGETSTSIKECPGPLSLFHSAMLIQNP